MQRFMEHWGLDVDARTNSLKADVLFLTESRELRTEQEISIVFSQGGNLSGVTLLDKQRSIDPEYFPKFFETKWEAFEFFDDGSLKITGRYRTNRQIGAFSVKILPKPEEDKRE